MICVWDESIPLTWWIHHWLVNPVQCNRQMMQFNFSIFWWLNHKLDLFWWVFFLYFLPSLLYHHLFLWILLRTFSHAMKSSAEWGSTTQPPVICLGVECCLAWGFRGSSLPLKVWLNQFLVPENPWRLNNQSSRNTGRPVVATQRQGALLANGQLPVLEPISDNEVVVQMWLGSFGSTFWFTGILGGGNSNIFLFSSLLGEDSHFD